MALRVATVLAVLVGLVASAKGQKNQRLLPLNLKLQGKLDPAERQNARAVIRYGLDGKATGVAVRAVAPRRLFVLTNWHAFDENPRAAIGFSDGRLGRIARHVARDELLDYALLEVTLPGGKPIAPVKVRGQHIEPGAEVYSISASSNPLFLPLPLRRTTARSERRWVKRAASRGRMRTLQRGWEIGDGNVGDMPVWGASHTVPSYLFALPNAPGMSGTPIFMASTHELTSLHWGGNHDPAAWRSAGVPMMTILRDLAMKLGDSAIPSDLRVPVKSMLDEAAPR
jgi:hypothetical protein